MIDWMQIFLIVVAYLLGSIPSAVWLGKFFFDIDIREHGSGNAGATNTLRVLGAKAGISVLVIDVVKGFVAVELIHLNPVLKSDPTLWLNFRIALCLAALIGHIFPIFAGFRGGKGVATLLGGVIALAPPAAAVAVVVFVSVLFIFRYVSLASMAGGLSFPFTVLFVMNNSPLFLVIFSCVIAALLIITHKKNIQRLFLRQESRFEPFTKNNSIK